MGKKLEIIEVETDKYSVAFKLDTSQKNLTSDQRLRVQRALGRLISQLKAFL